MNRQSYSSFKSTPDQDVAGLFRSFLTQMSQLVSDYEL